jgi:hypothetical protein
VVSFREKTTDRPTERFISNARLALQAKSSA